MASHFSEFDPFEISPEYQPVGAWGYIGYSILFGIPIVGLICIIVFSFSQSNINRRNYARSYLIVRIIIIALIAILWFTGMLSGAMANVDKSQVPAWLAWLF